MKHAASAHGDQVAHRLHCGGIDSGLNHGKSYARNGERAVARALTAKGVRRKRDARTAAAAGAAWGDVEEGIVRSGAPTAAGVGQRYGRAAAILADRNRLSTQRLRVGLTSQQA